jgi:hypothetical protein
VRRGRRHLPGMPRAAFEQAQPIAQGAVRCWPSRATATHVQPVDALVGCVAQQVVHVASGGIKGGVDTRQHIQGLLPAGARHAQFMAAD